MTPSRDLVSFYTGRKNAFEGQCRKVEERITTISWIRVSLILIAGCLAYLGFDYEYLWIILAGVLLLFAYFVRKHGQLNSEKRLLQNLTRINDLEVKAQQGDHSSFDDGAEFVDGHHPYTLDLDIFGKGSLFQRFNRTCSEPGKERLATILSSPLHEIAAIKNRQQTVAELSALVDYRQEFQAIGMIAPERKADQQRILDWLTLPTFVYGNRNKTWMLVVFPTAALLALLYWIIAGSIGLFIAVALTQWAIVGFHARRTMLLHEYIGNQRSLLEKFVAHYALLEKQDFRSPLAVELNHNSHEAQQQIRHLVSRSRALDLRLNAIANFLFNSVVLYDLQCVYRLEQWREKNRDHLAGWLKTIAEADSLNSLASFAFNHPGFVLPEFTTDLALMGEDLGHPLIPATERVCNDLAMNDRSSLWIITGANMAGKSTFLRAVGVNVVIALAGSVVCARRFVCPLMEVHSGMRNTDSINEHQSYFYAELQRLHGIVQCLNEGRQLLILLDEILKGTNSTDKLAGSEELVTQLVSHRCFALVATHDVALGAMAERHAAIQNYHFEARIQNDELIFDYRLRPGVSTGKNATFLMRKMGIIRSP